MGALRVGRCARLVGWFDWSRLDFRGGEWMIDRTPEPKLMAAVLTGANDGPGLRGMDQVLTSGARVLDQVLNRVVEIEDENVQETLLLALYRDLYTNGPARSPHDRIQLSEKNGLSARPGSKRPGVGCPPVQSYRFAFIRRSWRTD